MASEIDVCNTALAHLGEAANVSSIDPPEGSAYAEYCQRFYPIARDTLLEKFGWKFAKRRAYLSLTTDDSWEWSYVYAEPAAALRILSVLPATGKEADPTNEFTTMSNDSGGKIILTNLEAATAIYTVRVTDTTKFSPLFVDALGWMLAAYLAGPVIKGSMGIEVGKSALQFALSLGGMAAVSDANQQHNPVDHTPAWIAGR